MAPSKGAMQCRVALAITGALVGVIALFAFGAGLKNYHSAAWGGVSAVFASVVLFLHIQHLKDWWGRCYHSLSYFEILGFVVMLGCIPALGVYLSLAIVQHQGITPIASPYGYYVTCVWVFMTWKWSLALFLYSRSYKRLYDDEYILPPFTD
ncbi:heme transporter HRG1-like [Ptychodera flava]|uniref:heme transporter HRG1-like n=1 Tax=Ptychodera flava TaxID=63121 RepID=UPI00396AAB59